MSQPALDVLLVVSPPWGVGNPNIGIAYLSSHLRRQGLFVHTYDMNIDLFNAAPPDQKPLWDVEQYHQWGESRPVDELVAGLGVNLERAIGSCLEHDAPVVGLGCTYSNIEFVLFLAEQLKSAKPDSRVVLGGPGTNSSSSRERIRRSGSVDALVVGEGERPLEAYVRAVKNGSTSPHTPGLWVFDEMDEAELELPVGTGSLDDLAFPDFFGNYLNDYVEDSLPIIFSRGCKGNCAFCEISLLWRTYRARSSEAILAELEHHIVRLGVRKFHNFDSAINQDPELLERVVGGILARGWGDAIEWDGSFIIGNRFDRPFFDRLRRAGCRTLYFGLESGSDKVLRLMRKPFNIDWASRNIRAAAGAGIDVFLNIIVGFPGETEREFEESVDFLRSHREHIAKVGAVTTLQLVEGTPLFEQADDFGVEIPETDFNIRWRLEDDSNTLEIRADRQARLLSVLEELDMSSPVCASLNDGSEGEAW